MKMTKEKIFELDYPQNLLRAVFTDWATEKEEKEGLENLEPRLVPADQAGTLEYVMATTLRERECQVLHMRYWCKMTLDECAECFGVTRERIRQLEATAIRKLRHPARARLILKGMAFWREQEKSGLDNANYERGRLAGYNQAINDYAMQMDYKAIRDAKVEKARKEAEEKEREGNVYYQPIDIMDLSVRSYNCLKRAKIETVGDTVKNIEVIRAGKIRNLGRKSAEEVEMRLKGLGVL